MRVASADFADNVCRHNPGMTIEELLGKIFSESEELFLARIEVSSTHPFEITHIKDFRQTDEEAEITKVLLSTFIIRVIRNVTGLTYVLSDSRRYRDNTAIKLQFVLDGSSPPHPNLR